MLQRKDYLKITTTMVVGGLLTQLPTTSVLAETQAMEEVVVIAERELGLRRERDAINKISVLETEDVSKLPDINAAEAIQRLPGVYIDEDRGEGRFVSIRGASSSFNRVKLNGASIGSPESNGLSVPLDIFSAGSISSIQVTKSVTPAQDANSVGGEISLRTPSVIGTGNEGFEFLATVGQQDLGDGDRYRASASGGWTFGSNDQFGLLLNGATNKRDFVAETVEISDWDLFDDVPGFDGQDIWAPDDLELRHQTVERERNTLGAVFEWKPDESSRAYAQVTYTEFEEDEYRQRLIIQLTDAFDDFVAPIALRAPNSASDERNDTAGGSLPRFSSIARAGLDATTRREIDFQRDFTPQEFLVYNVGYEWEGDTWSFDADIGYSATEEDRQRQSLDFRQEEDLNGDDVEFLLGFNAQDDSLAPTLTNLSGGNVNDPALFRFDDFDLFGDLREDDVLTVSTNAKRMFELSNSNTLELQFGLRGTLRERKISFDDTDYDDPINGGADSLRLNDPRFLDGSVATSFLDGEYNFGPGVSTGGLEFLAGQASTLLSDEDRETGIEYDAEEDVWAAYVQGTFQLDKLTILGGLRVERTEFDVASLVEISVTSIDANGNELFDESEFVRVTDTSSYTDVFPSLHLRYDWRENLILRASVGKTIRRPNFNALSPGREVEVEQDLENNVREITIEGGNPELRPLESINYEVSVDLYDQTWGAVGLAVFYKDISDITVDSVSQSQTNALPNGVETLAPGVLSGTFEVEETTFNSDSDGEILGVELSYSKKFVELPKPFDGLGIDASVTWTDSEQIVSVFDGSDFVGNVELPFEGQSPMSGNVTLAYEKEKWEVRLTYTFIESYLNSIQAEDEERLIFENEYNLDFDRLGFKALYHYNDSVTFSLEGNNLNDEHLRRYHANRGLLRENERNSYWWEFGIRAQF